jgi:hypothetical protein
VPTAEIPSDGAAAPSRELFADAVTRPYDIIFVIDRSQSTESPSGIDLDGDGRIGGPGFLVSLLRQIRCDRAAGELGIRIYPYGIAVDKRATEMLRAIADRSGGTFAAAQEPQRLRLRFPAPAPAVSTPVAPRP